MPTISIDEKPYRVKHTFSADRCLIDFDGTTVFADRVGGDWMLGAPASTPEEHVIFKQLVGPDGTTVTVTTPDLPPPDDIIPGD